MATPPQRPRAQLTQDGKAAKCPACRTRIGEIRTHGGIRSLFFPMGWTSDPISGVWREAPYSAARKDPAWKPKHRRQPRPWLVWEERGDDFHPFSLGSGSDRIITEQRPTPFKIPTLVRCPGRTCLLTVELDAAVLNIRPFQPAQPLIPPAALQVLAQAIPELANLDRPTVALGPVKVLQPILTPGLPHVDPIREYLTMQYPTAPGDVLDRWVWGIRNLISRAGLRKHSVAAWKAAYACENAHRLIYKQVRAIGVEKHNLGIPLQTIRSIVAQARRCREGVQSAGQGFDERCTSGYYKNATA